MNIWSREYYISCMSVLQAVCYFTMQNAGAEADHKHTGADVSISALLKNGETISQNTVHRVSYIISTIKLF